jgi:hypothetical protein
MCSSIVQERFTRPQAVQPDGSGARDETVIRSQREWLRIRQALNRHRSDLTRLATQLYSPEVRVGDTGLLVPEDWRLAKPIPLDSIELVWTQAPAPVITGHHEETRPLRPLTSPQRRYDRYHKAMRDLDRPRLFENRVCYRLLGVERMPAHDAATLAFGHMRYFHMIDVGEASRPRTCPHLPQPQRHPPHRPAVMVGPAIPSAPR